MLDPQMFKVVPLIRALLDRYDWRTTAEIIPAYMPPHPGPDTRPSCVVRHGEWFLRYSKGPKQGHFWDSYGDDYDTPEYALVALLAADAPPSFTFDARVKPYVEFTIPLRPVEPRTEEATEPARWKCRRCNVTAGADGGRIRCPGCLAYCASPGNCGSKDGCSFVAAGSEAQREEGEANG